MSVKRSTVSWGPRIVTSSVLGAPVWVFNKQQTAGRRKTCEPTLHTTLFLLEVTIPNRIAKRRQLLVTTL